ncbi:MAG: right-handed parallel beta-helix repeat-containing protein, partial [Candidatus Eisenbacteria sp.]|nr:right-handed parallel beta-helix repeat-containing protein [Candidatus Eisenbacteria bacterium]
HILLGREGVQQEKGLPAIPDVCRSVIVPDDRAMSVSVISESHIDLPSMPIAPSKGPLPPGIDPSTVPYIFDPFYDSEAVYPPTAAEGHDPYILRDFRGMVVDANVFQYAPSTNTLRVYTRMLVEVTLIGPGSVNVLDRSRPLDRMDPEFAKLYDTHFLNFRGDRYEPVLEQGNLLIIAADAPLDFVSGTEPLYSWKLQKGIPTKLVALSEICSPPDTTEIQAFILNEYLTSDLAYVLLVGDAEHVPPRICQGYSSGYYPAAASDPKYSLLAGDDSYPEIFIGRFSAQSMSNLDTQVLRTVHYERDIGHGAHWLESASGIADSSVVPQHEKCAAYFMEITRNSLLSYGYNEVDQFYCHSGPGCWITPDILATAFNEGRGLVNYMGHGGQFSWSVAGFATCDIDALTNMNMLPFIHCHACLNGYFDHPTLRCFAEAWMHATHEGLPTGAIATYMQSRETTQGGGEYAQAETVELLVTGAMHTVGGLCFNGACRMMDEEHWFDNCFKSWIVFGDPSLSVRTRDPDSLTVIHAEVILLGGGGQYPVEVCGVEGALCALYADDVLYGSALTNGAGEAVIVMNPEPQELMDLTLTVTAHDKVTYIAEVEVVAPYVINPDGSGDYPTIQAAIDAAPEGMLIYLTDGVFTGDGNRNIDFLGKAITVKSQSGDPAACAIDCQFAGRGFFFCSGEAAESVLQGVTVANGRPIEGYPDNLGGGVRCSGASPTINNCIFDDNEAGTPYGRGGGMYCHDCSPTITSCTFSNNSTSMDGGAMYCHDCSPTIISCTFSNNSTLMDGGAMFLDNSAPTISYCVFSENSALRNGGGACSWLASSLVFTNCTFAENAATFGAGFFVSHNSSATAENTIIAFSTEGAAIYCSRRGVALTCCDLYGNAGGDWVGCIAAQDSINGNIHSDPLFCWDANPEDPYTLWHGSPCLPGHNPACSLIGARPVGCDENSIDQEPVFVPYTLLMARPVPNPFTCTTCLRYSVPSTSRSISVRLWILDVSGRLVRSLVNADQRPGMYATSWDGYDHTGRRLGSGIYLCRLTMGDVALTRRVVIVR